MWGHSGSWPKGLLEERLQQWEVGGKCPRAEEGVTPQNRDALTWEQRHYQRAVPDGKPINFSGTHPQRWRASYS